MVEKIYLVKIVIILLYNIDNDTWNQYSIV